MLKSFLHNSKKDIKELLGITVKKENKRLEKSIIRKYCQIMYQKQAGKVAYQKERTTI